MPETAKVLADIEAEMAAMKQAIDAGQPLTAALLNRYGELGAARDLLLDVAHERPVTYAASQTLPRELPLTDTDWLRMEPLNARPSGWLRRAADRAERHTCLTPTREVFHPVPGRPAADGVGVREIRPDGDPGDVWRCPGCGWLWQVQLVEPQGNVGGPRPAWGRPAWWLRLLHWAGRWP